MTNVWSVRKLCNVFSIAYFRGLLLKFRIEKRIFALSDQHAPKPVCHHNISAEQCWELLLRCNVKQP